MSAIVIYNNGSPVDLESFPASGKEYIGELAGNFETFVRFNYGQDHVQGVLPSFVDGDAENPHRDMDNFIKITLLTGIPGTRRVVSTYMYADPNFSLYTPGQLNPIFGDCYCSIGGQPSLLRYEQVRHPIGKVIESEPTREGVIHRDKGLLFTEEAFAAALKQVWQFISTFGLDNSPEIFHLPKPSIIISLVLNESLKCIDNRNAISPRDETTTVLNFKNLVPKNTSGLFEVEMNTLCGDRRVNKSILSTQLEHGVFQVETHLVSVRLNPFGLAHVEILETDSRKVA